MFICWTAYHRMYTYEHSQCGWPFLNGKPVLFWKGISGLKFPCFLFYACLLPEWRREPVEFRAIPILLRKLPNIARREWPSCSDYDDIMLFLAECICIFTSSQAIPFKRKFYDLFVLPFLQFITKTTRETRGHVGATHRQCIFIKIIELTCFKFRKYFIHVCLYFKCIINLFFLIIYHSYLFFHFVSMISLSQAGGMLSFVVRITNQEWRGQLKNTKLFYHFIGITNNEFVL